MSAAELLQHVFPWETAPGMPVDETEGGQS